MSLRKFRSTPIICVSLQVLPTHAQKYMLNCGLLVASDPQNQSCKYLHRHKNNSYKNMNNYLTAYVHLLFVCCRKTLSNY